MAVNDRRYDNIINLYVGATIGRLLYYYRKFLFFIVGVGVLDDPCGEAEKEILLHKNHFLNPKYL